MDYKSFIDLKQSFLLLSTVKDEYQPFKICIFFFLVAFLHKASPIGAIYFAIGRPTTSEAFDFCLILISHHIHHSRVIYWFLYSASLPMSIANAYENYFVFKFNVSLFFYSNRMKKKQRRSFKLRLFCSTISSINNITLKTNKSPVFPLSEWVVTVESEWSAKKDIAFLFRNRFRQS